MPAALRALRFTAFALAVTSAALLPASAEPGKTTCPVTGSAITPGANSPQEVVNGQPVYFCCNDCVKAFRADPEKYLLSMDPGKCPVLGNPARPDMNLRLVVNNQLYYACCDACPAKMAKEPQKYFKTLVDPVTKKSFALTADSPRETYRGQQFFFADAKSKETFDATPEQFLIVFGDKTP